MQYTRTTIKAHELRQDMLVDASHQYAAATFIRVISIEDISHLLDDAPNGMLDIRCEDGTSITRKPYDYVEVFIPPVM